MSSPVWLLQLWCNAIFEPSMKVTILSNLTWHLENRRVENTRLVLLTLDDIGRSTKEAFKSYFFMYVDCSTFVFTMSLFVNWSYGLDWFKREFLNLSSEHQFVFVDIWIAFLKSNILLTKILTGKAGLGLVSYQPNLVAKIFGFDQCLPKSFYIHRHEICFPNATLFEESYPSCLDWQARELIILTPFAFPYFYVCAHKFEEWWLTYLLDVFLYHSILIQHLTKVFSSL